MVAYGFTLHLRIHDHTTWFWRCLGTAFGHFLLGSHNFMVTALGSGVKWPFLMLDLSVMMLWAVAMIVPSHIYMLVGPTISRLAWWGPCKLSSGPTWWCGCSWTMHRAIGGRLPTSYTWWCLTKCGQKTPYNMANKGRLFIHVTKGCEEKKNLGFLVDPVGGPMTMTRRNTHQSFKSLGYGT